MAAFILARSVPDEKKGRGFHIGCRGFCTKQISISGRHIAAANFFPSGCQDGAIDPGIFCEYPSHVIFIDNLMEIHKVFFLANNKKFLQNLAQLKAGKSQDCFMAKMEKIVSGPNFESPAKVGKVLAINNKSIEIWTCLVLGRIFEKRSRLASL